MVFLSDLALQPSASARILADGSLVAEVYAARTGFQDYLGIEADPDNEHGFRDKAVVKVYRPESEVFARDSIATYADTTVTINHPPEMVNSANWRKYGVGDAASEILRDGEKVRIGVTVRDAEAVKAATTTHKQISMGYSAKLVFPKDGKHPDGTACDAYQTDIRINHLAFVPAARGGPELRVIDERPLPTLKTEKPVTKMLIDGLTVDVSDAETAKATITSLIAARDAEAAKVKKAEEDDAENKKQIVAKDAEITKLTKDLADAKPTPAQLRDAAKAYALTCDKAKAMGVEVTDAMDEAAIKRAVVDKAMGDKAKDYSDEHVAISFDTLTKDAKPAQAGVQPLGTPVNFGDGFNDNAFALAGVKMKKEA